MVIRTYHEVQNKPVYFIRCVEVQGSDQNDEPNPAARSGNVEGQNE
jgi:hypothetical protein